MDDSAESWINYDFTKLDPPPTNAGGLNYITIWFLAGLVWPQRLSQDPKTTGTWVCLMMIWNDLLSMNPRRLSLPCFIPRLERGLPMRFLVIKGYWIGMGNQWRSGSFTVRVSRRFLFPRFYLRSVEISQGLSFPIHCVIIFTVIWNWIKITITFK